MTGRQNQVPNERSDDQRSATNVANSDRPSNDNATSDNNQFPPQLVGFGQATLPARSLAPFAMRAQNLPAHQQNPRPVQASLGYTISMRPPFQLHQPLGHPSPAMNSGAAAFQLVDPLGNAFHPMRQPPPAPNFACPAGSSSPGLQGPRPSSQWGQAQQFRPQFTTVFPRPQSNASPWPSPSIEPQRSCQRGATGPWENINHEQLWNDQSAKNRKVSQVIIKLVSKVAEHRRLISELEEEVYSLKAKGEEPAGAAQGSKRTAAASAPHDSGTFPAASYHQALMRPATSGFIAPHEAKARFFERGQPSGPPTSTRDTATYKQILYSLPPQQGAGGANASSSSVANAGAARNSNFGLPASNAPDGYRRNVSSAGTQGLHQFENRAPGWSLEGLVRSARGGNNATVEDENSGPEDNDGGSDALL